MNITQQINELQQQGVIDQVAISKRIMERLEDEPKNVLLDVLRTTIPGYVLRVQGGQRRSARMEMRGEIIPATTNTVSQHTTVRVPSVSRRVREFRTAWDKRLDTVIYLSEGAKRLRDCVKADLLAYATSLRNQASALNSSADEYEEFARRLPDDTTTLGSIDLTDMEVAA